jgi:penicillin-binding protein 1A
VRTLAWILVAVILMTLAGVGSVGYVFYRYGQDLPDYSQLADYKPPTVSRVYAGDGRLLAEYAREKRVFVPIDVIPRRVINAFVSAEDKNFYDHYGIDPPSIARAALTNLQNLGTDRRPVGASTITQQVAKNFLLSDRVSIERKIREAILAFRIEHAYEKDRILELYLNEIYLGSGSFGVAAAALNYFNKSLDNLTIAEAAYLAALPKAPNNYQPDTSREAAVARRNWVIQQMEANGYITSEQAVTAMEEPLETRRRDPKQVARAPYFAEEVRRKLVDRYGEDTLYGGGLSVHTTVDPELQRHAENALRDGLIAYDRDHGYRGAYNAISVAGNWAAKLKEVAAPEGMPRDWARAAVLGTDADGATIGFVNGARARLPMAGMAWARPHLEGQHVGKKPSRPGDVVAVGDVVLVSQREAGDGYALEQMPAVNGGIVAMDPHTGRVLAMQGGFDFARSQFNRVTQAKRQPGSAFKPFVYLTALEAGFTPSTIILDAPFVIDQGPGLDKWKPANYSDQFYGPTPMRVGIEQSRNLMTVRLAQTVGMPEVAATAEEFGLYDDLKHQLAMALGAGETTLMKLTAGYGMFVNGGKRIQPHLIDRVQNRRGKTIFRQDKRNCPDCNADLWLNQKPPEIPDTRGQVTDPASAYQVVSMLRGVVERGTGRRMRAIGKPVAGKTGTTNDSFDTWFMGFTPDLVAGVYVGFDEHRTLGPRSYGSNTAGPIFKQFMTKALEGEPGIPFRTPEGIRMVRMDLSTGRRAGPDSDKVILEAFKAGNSPGDDQVVIRGGQPGDGQGDGGTQGQPGEGEGGGPAVTGASGLY